MRLVLRGAVATLLLAGCASSSARVTAVALPEDLAGCFALQAQKGLYYTSPRLELSRDTISRQTRLFFRDTLPAWTLTRLDERGRDAYGRDFDVRYWWRYPGSDSIGVITHTGLSGTELKVRFTESADTLRGTAVEHWDFGPPFSSPGAPVSLVRVPCLAEGDAGR